MKEVNSDLAERVRQENIRMHNRDSLIYDVRHPYMRDKGFQKSFLADLSLVNSLLVHLDVIRALDCGSGTGNLTLKFLDFGWHVTALDISSGMLKALRDKVPIGIDHFETVEADAEAYLSEQEGTFDVVAFGATLHHLPDYVTALELACNALKSGGILYITGEPTSVAQSGLSERSLLRLDEYCNVFYKLLFHPRHTLTVLGKVLGLKKVDEVDETLAEFHVDTGIDQDLCRSVLEASGFTLLHFEEFGYFGFRFVRFLAWLGGISPHSQFKLLARRD